MRTSRDMGAGKARAADHLIGGGPLHQSPAVRQLVTLTWRIVEFLNPDALVGFLYANLVLRPGERVVVWDVPGFRGLEFGRFLGQQLQVPAIPLGKYVDTSSAPPKSFLYVGDGSRVADWCNENARYVIFPIPSFEEFDWERVRAEGYDKLLSTLTGDNYRAFVTDMLRETSYLCWRRIVLAVHTTPKSSDSYGL